jgi:hypothetical protein
MNQRVLPIITASIGLILGASTPFAGELNTSADNTLNEFVSGTPALAAEVNENFARSANAINDNHARIEILESELQTANPVGISCPGNDENDIMVRVGPLCVDRFEASVWSTAGGGTQLGTGNNGNIPCENNGNDCSIGADTPIFARSVQGVIPTDNITWFQAQQACANSGKRLLSNAEWQMAAAGSPDPGELGADTANYCNTFSGEKAETGSSLGGTEPCLSNWDVADMVGNVNEWTADWMAGTATPPTGAEQNDDNRHNNEDYGLDAAISIQRALQPFSEGTKFPAAIYRGGGYGAHDSAGVFLINASWSPALAADAVGFRCAR